MSKSRILVCLLGSMLAGTSLCYAATPDRIAGELNNGQKVQISGNVHGLARPENDLGRADSSRLMEHILLSFRLSPAQQKDLDQFLAQLGNRSSKNFHKYLTPAQFAARFGMSQNDLDKVIAWLESEGFTNIKVGHTGDELSFDGTVGEVESTFSLEMHQYLVDGQIYLANSTNPSVPAAIAGSVIGVHGLNGFAPRPRVKVHPDLTSYVSGNHFLTPADFVTIYGLTNLYSAGITGSGQKIAVVGQSTVSTTDLANFRSNALLPVNPVTMQLVGGTATRCSGDEGESDLDLEWTGGIARDATIYFLYAGLGSGDTCGGNRSSNNVWNALDEALTNPVAPFVSTSYGYCEQGEPAGFVDQNGTLETWIKAGQALGVTLTSASGDAGAADCDNTSETVATGGLAVDAPASIPETTGAGGNEFNGDGAGTVTGTAPNTTAGATQYWGASGTGSDAISTALTYIPEEAWNDTKNPLNTGDFLSASGGGASIYFSTPSWQNVAGVPTGGARYVPDISLNASPFHDPYLVCSEDFSATSCSSGFRESAGGDFSAVGGTSAVAPSFTAILALINQYVGNTPPTGLAPVNPTLYSLYPNNSTTHAFNDITSSSNIVPCTPGATDTGCPTTGTAQFGFNAGTGYDEVTGLGSVNGFNLAQAWAATLGGFTVTAGTLSPASVAAGTSAGPATVTIAPTNGFTGTVSFSCSGLPSGATCSFNPTTVTGGSGTTQVTIQTLANTPVGTSSVTVVGKSGSVSGSSNTLSLTVTATNVTFTLGTTIAGGTLSVAQGQTTGAVNMTVTSTSNPSFIVSSGSSTQTSLPVTYTCTGLPSESTCFFNGSQTTVTTQLTTVTLTIQTTAPTTKLERPLDRGPNIFYAVLLPGILGIFVTVGSPKRVSGGVRVLGLILVLGFSTMWLASCGGSSTSNNKNPGTPVGSSSVTVNATTNGGPSATLQFTLSVSAAAR